MCLRKPQLLKNVVFVNNFRKVRTFCYRGGTFKKGLHRQALFVGVLSKAKVITFDKDHWNKVLLDLLIIFNGFIEISPDQFSNRDVSLDHF